MRIQQLFCLYLLLTAGTGFALTQTQTRLRAQHDQVLKEINSRSPSGKLAELDDPRFPPLLKQGWTLAGAWAADYFGQHSAAGAKQLEHIFDGFAPPPHGVKSKYGDFLEYTDYYFEGSAVRVAPSIYVIEASYGVWFRTGTFMVVARNRDGHFEALWNIKDIAEKHYPLEDEIGRWAHLTRRAYYNGPLNVDRLLPLTPSRDGKARFLVNAYQGADGGTQLDQLSIWEWDGSEAKPLFIDVYEKAVDYGGFLFDGQTITIKTKENLDTLFSCGQCPDPRAVWTLRITPTAVQDLGRRFLKPEIKWADELLTRIARGEDTNSVASAQVRAKIESAIQEIKTDNTKYDIKPEDFSWGMLGGCRVLRRGENGAFILELDEAKIRFRYSLHKGKPYFTNVDFE